jgi:hypothetical protein
MREAYATDYLHAEQIDRAFVLITAFAPAVEASEWRRFCLASPSASAVDGRHRIAVVENPIGHLKGIAAFAACIEDPADRWLDVPVFAPLSAADGAGVTKAMLDFLRGEARRHNCSTIRFGSLEPDAWHQYIAGAMPVGSQGITLPVTN